MARTSGRRKVTVIGAGMVGGVVAQMLALRDYADVVLDDGADPATASSIVVTTATDVASMGLLLGLATVVIR